MLAGQLSYTFDLLFDSIANFSSPGYTNQEKSELLTQAQENIYMDVVNPLTTPRSSAVQDELNKIVLSELIRNTGEILASDSSTGPYGAELITSTGWTSTGWTGNYLGFTHTPGNTTALSNTLAAVSGNHYRIEYTITNRTAGTVVVAFGGTSVTASATSDLEFTASTTGNITVTPTTDFNGTIVLSIKVVSTITGLTNLPYGQFVLLPVDFFFPLTELATIEFLSTSYFYGFTDLYPGHRKTNVRVKPIDQLEYNYEVRSDIRNPYEDLIWRLEYGRQTPTAVIGNSNKKIYELITNEEFKVYSYKSTYYRRLVDIDLDNSVTSELDPIVHRTIVRDAIKIAAVAIGDTNKYQMATVTSQ